MKTKLLAFICAIFLIVACGNDQKKTASPTENSETPKVDMPKPITVEDKIAGIKENYAKVEDQIKSLEKKTATIDEGGWHAELEGYFMDHKPVKISKSEVSGHWFGKTSYYFDNGKLFFVFQQESGEASLHGPYTDKEVRIYIYDNVLIRVLEKEKTVADIEDMELSKVKNIDVTEQWKTKTNVVSTYIKVAQESSAKLLANKKVGLDNGRWISKDDANSGIEIKDGKFIMFYKGSEISPNDSYNYELTEHEGVEYLTLANTAGDELKYAILEYAEDIFILSYLARGNTLTYTKEK